MHRAVLARCCSRLFVVPLPDETYDAQVLDGPRVRGWRALFTGRYRDLARDVHRRFTAAGWAERHPPVRARHGASKDPGLPTGSRLALLEQLVADRFGHGAVEQARAQADLRLRTTHEVLEALKAGPPPGRDGVARWARQVARGMGEVLGDPTRARVWLSLCWAAWRVSRWGLADGFALLHEAAFETLVRRADHVPKAGRSKGATLNWVVNSLGLRQLDAHARRLDRTRVRPAHTPLPA